MVQVCSGPLLLAWMLAFVVMQFVAFPKYPGALLQVHGI